MAVIRRHDGGETSTGVMSDGDHYVELRWRRDFVAPDGWAFRVIDRYESRFDAPMPRSAEQAASAMPRATGIDCPHANWLAAWRAALDDVAVAAGDGFHFWIGAEAERAGEASQPAQTYRRRGSGRARGVSVDAPRGIYVSLEWRFDRESDVWQVWLEEISYAADGTQIVRRLDIPHPLNHDHAATAIQAGGGPGSTCDVDHLADALYECLKDIEKQEGPGRGGMADAPTAESPEKTKP